MNELLRLLCNRPLAITKDALLVLLEIATNRKPAAVVSGPEFAARVEAKALRAGVAKNGAIAVIPVHGALFQHASYIDEYFGIVSYDALGKLLRGAIADPAISGIVLDFDSPGGDAMGCPELAAEILAAREQKPIVAQASGLMCSAAYMLAAACQEISAQPSALVGSVGCILEHWDYSGMLEQEGIKVNLITAGEHKGELHPAKPLDDDAKAHWQSIVDEAYDQFVKSVAAGRGVTPAKVRSDYGQGRVLTAKAAQAAGMVDRLGSLPDTLARLLGSGAGGKGTKAEGEVPAVTATAPMAGIHPTVAAAQLELAKRG